MRDGEPAIKINIVLDIKDGMLAWIWDVNSEGKRLCDGVSYTRDDDDDDASSLSDCMDEISEFLDSWMTSETERMRKANATPDA